MLKNDVESGNMYNDVNWAYQIKQIVRQYWLIGYLDTTRHCSDSFLQN